MKAKLLLSLSVLFSLAALATARPARAMSGDTLTVLRGGGYGMVAGTALGLVGFAANQKLRSVPVGTSVGLYVGLAVGLYVIWDRSTPESPEYRAKWIEWERGEAPLVQVSLPIKRF